MKPKYLGDCLDFYKRWFLTEFFPEKKLAALPMLTEPWETTNDAAIYGTLLGVDVIQDELLPNTKVRAGYFDPAQQGDSISCDLFLDPDTGLRVGARPDRKRYDEYLFDKELKDFLLPVGSDRVAVVYDQSIARGSEVESASSKMQALRSMELWAFAYAAQVAMVVVSRDRRRIAALLKHARSLAHILPARVLANVSDDGGTLAS